MTLTISGMSPVKIGTTVLAVQDLAVSPEINVANFRHSGNEFPSVGVVPSAMPKVRFRTPFNAAYTLIGMKMLVATTFEVYFATFASGIRQTGAVHVKYGLATSAQACCYIDGASVSQNGILMADIAVQLLSADGVTHPLTKTTTVALPTLASEPQLHTMGPFALNATRIDGATQWQLAQNIQLYTPINDGDAFPRTVGWMGADPQIQVAHEDPLTALTSLGLDRGVNITTSAAVFGAGIDPTTQLRQTTGVSLTISTGRVVTGPIQFDLNRPAKMGFTIRALSATTTHPVVVATGATLP